MRHATVSDSEYELGAHSGTICVHDGTRGRSVSVVQTFVPLCRFFFASRCFEKERAARTTPIVFQPFSFLMKTNLAAGVAPRSLSSPFCPFVPPFVLLSHHNIYTGPQRVDGASTSGGWLRVAASGARVCAGICAGVAAAGVSARMAEQTTP